MTNNELHDPEIAEVRQDLNTARNWLRFPHRFQEQPEYQSIENAAESDCYPASDTHDGLILEYAKEVFDDRSKSRETSIARCADLLRFQVAVVGGELAFIRFAQDLHPWAKNAAIAGTAITFAAMAIALFCYRMPLRATRPFPMDIERVAAAGEERMQLSLARSLGTAAVAITYELERIAYVTHAALLVTFVGLLVFAVGALWW